MVAAREAGRGGRVRTPQETAAAGSVTVVDDGRAPATSSSPGGSNGAGPSQSSNGSAPAVRSASLYFAASRSYTAWTTAG